MDSKNRFLYICPFMVAPVMKTLVFFYTTPNALTYHQFVGNLACIHIFELSWGITLPLSKIKLVSRELKIHFNIDFITNQLYFVRTCSTSILARCLATRFCFRVLLECLLTSYDLKFSRRQRYILRLYIGNSIVF